MKKIVGILLIITAAMMITGCGKEKKEEKPNKKAEEIKVNTNEEVIKDKDGNEMITLTGFVGDSLAAGETRVINSYYGQDLSSAASITYEIVR